MAQDDLRSQLVLALPARSGDSPLLARLVAAAAQVAPIATVVIEADPELPILPPELAPAVEQIQALGIATLIARDASLARLVKADGVHLPASKAAPAGYREARETVGSRFIVGVDVGRTRHDAMTLGEEGADYIAFGIPAHVEDRDTARARRRDLIAWWSEIFEIPCVAFDVETPEDAHDLAASGADFIALRVPAGLVPEDVEAYLSPFVAQLAITAPAD
ncbi:MAG: thiamine phosphate synthase [Hyphomicrobium sp.]